LPKRIFHARIDGL